MTDLHKIWLLLALHWIGDFVCQTDWMARNKSKNIFALLSHVSVYSTVLFFGTALFFSDCLTFVLANGALHFATDFVTSRVTSKLYAKGEIHYFFVAVGFDQLIHFSIFILTLWMLT